ncbi:hypothetical protein, partial [Clostridium sp. DSM 1985]
MKTCKKCKHFEEENFECKEFRIHISSTLNATKCIKYQLDDKKEKSLQNTKKRKLQKKDYEKKKRAKKCIDCENNQ